MGIIRVLSPETARLIAAGEVIDRPAAALRELLDNAIDSGAAEISVEIEGGGTSLIRVSDDGSGMDRGDLELCVLPHATSKIATADDLQRARTLGFRGEALASIAAVARLEILTRDTSSNAASRLVAGPGIATRIEGKAGRKGSTVTVTGLFDTFPARKRFLKRPQAEAALCRQVFVDKAIAHPGIVFRYGSGSSRDENLLAAARLERAASLLPDAPDARLRLLEFFGPGFRGEAVVAPPPFYRSDRRLMQVFVNRRRIQDWGLLGAMDYAFSGYLPGGAHPCSLLFLEIDPELVDFNIHPAKREARFKEPEAPRHAAIEAIQRFLSEVERRNPDSALPDAAAELGIEPGGAPSAGASSWTPIGTSAGAWRGWDDLDSLRERATPPPSPSARSRPFRYLGRGPGPFLVFEMDDSVWFLDQHAAHERMLFDELVARGIESQELLIPLSYEAKDDEEEALLAELASQAGTGFRMEREGSSWTVLAAPAALREDPLGSLQELLRNRPRSGGALREALAVAACRSAVKDGDELDPASAEELVARALELPEPRCPHGRPIWARITREQLETLVRRRV
jgi:DNA mismatch repair protein MutL